MFDKMLLVSENQDLAKATGSYLGTNILDVGANDSEIGNCEDLRVVARCTEDFASANSNATVVIAVVDGDAADLSDAEVLVETRAYTIAELKAYEKLLDVGVPVPNKRYMGIRYTIGGEATTAGKMTALVNPR